MAKKKILNKKSLDFLEKYLNNAAPTGYEWDGQKLWMDYLKPYVDEFITDTYGTAVGIINPKATTTACRRAKQRRIAARVKIHGTIFRKDQTVGPKQTRTRSVWEDLCAVILSAQDSRSHVSQADERTEDSILGSPASFHQGRRG